MVKPGVVYAISDKGRSPGEQKMINEAREVLKQINWKCRVITDYSKKNQGPKKRLSKGFSNFFKKFETGIFLEHDCLPDPSFFYYCEELLDKYKNNEKIMHISGNNFQNNIKRGNGSYYFSKIPHIWGWASWRRAWKYYDSDIKSFNKIDDKLFLDQIFNDKKVTKYWLDIFEKTHKGIINTWDYQWTYAVLKKNGLCINPQKNLVTNIGFHKGAANTTNENDSLTRLSLNSIGKLIHPKKIKANLRADKLILKQNFKIDFYHINILPILKRIYGLWLLLTNFKKYKQIKNS
jgi:hypothetical protein